MALALGSGCATDVDADSPSLLPWNEPAGWESTIPGTTN
jgi:hypothetical protein